MVDGVLCRLTMGDKFPGYRTLVLLSSMSELQFQTAGSEIRDQSPKSASVHKTTQVLRRRLGTGSQPVMAEHATPIRAGRGVVEPRESTVRG